MDETNTSMITTNSNEKISTHVEKITYFEEEEEEYIEEQIQTQENVEINNSTTISQTMPLMDEVTQTDSTVFEKTQDKSSEKKQLFISNQSQAEINIDQNQFENFMEQEFYPQFKANEGKIDSQIDKIDQAIEKLRSLTKNFYQNDEKTPSTSTSASIDCLSQSLHLDPIFDENKQATPKKIGKKIKKKVTSKPISSISNTITEKSKLKKKSRKRSIKKHKRFLSPLKMTTEKRMDMLRRKKSPDKDNQLNQVYVPKGLSQFDPIVLRSGYPIVFNYEPKEPVRHERIPHGPLKTLYKNGDIKYEFHDGTVRVKTNNGFIYTYYTNGDKQQEFPDGVNAYRYNSNSSVEFRCPDNTLMYFFEDGQIEEHFSNGETRVRFPDRSEIKIFVDNSYVYKDRNGVKKKGKMQKEHLKKLVNSPVSESSSGISTPTPRAKIPISTNVSSPVASTNEKVQDNVSNVLDA